MALLEKLKSGTRSVFLTAALGMMSLSIPGCYSLQNTTTNDDLYYSPKKTKIENTQGITKTVQEQDVVSQKSRSFIGAPVYLNQNTKDLDFILESYDVDANKKYTINVYEKWDESNSKNLDMVKTWVVDALNDSVAEFRIEGFYTKSTFKDNVETGKLDPFAVIHVAKTMKDGKLETSEEVAFTDKRDSKIYTKEYTDIIFTDVYHPGHMIHSVHYPIAFSPYWDSDGDGIPNSWDPWPYTFGPWVDVNNNGIWDWYDPGFGPRYWGYWDNYYCDHPSVIVVWHDYYNHHHDHNRDGRHHRFYDNYRDHWRQHDRIVPRDNHRDNPGSRGNYSGNTRTDNGSRTYNPGSRRDNNTNTTDNRRTYTRPTYTRPVQTDQNNNQGTRGTTDQNRTYTRPANSNNNNSSTTQPRRESNTNNNRTYTPSNNTRTYNQSENNRTYTRPSNNNNNGGSSRTYTPSSSSGSSSRTYERSSSSSSGSTYTPSSSSGSSSRSYSSGSSGSSSSSSGSSSSSSSGRSSSGSSRR